MAELSSDLASLKIERSKSRASSGSSNGGRAPGRPAGRVVSVALLGGVSALVYWGCRSLESQLFKTVVRIDSVTEESPAAAHTSLSATGHVTPRRHSKVGSSMGGSIARLYVQEGELVQAGQLLAVLDAADQRGRVAAAHAKVLAARARVASTRASAGELDAQVAREKQLLERGAAARAVYEDLAARAATARAVVEAAEAEARAAEAEHALTRINLGRTQILAPIAGTVLTKPLEVGETLDSVTPILELADLDSLVVEVDVPEARLGLVRVGGAAEIQLEAFPGVPLLGRVVEVAKQIELSKATAAVRVAFPAERHGALPGMSARVRLLTDAPAQELLRAAPSKVVPRAAVVLREGRSVVYVAEAGVVRALPVVLGAARGDGVVLLSGPEPGAHVVVSPPDDLVDGQTVREEEGS